MADNVAVTAGSGTSIATDDVSNIHFQKVKLDGGGDGVSVPIIAGAQAAAASLPVAHATEDVARVGIVTETAPATDTASSGLNGRLQRVAQRLTSLIALLPASIGGPKTAAASLSTTLASDDPAVATLGATNGAAVITDATGTIQQYLRGMVKRWVDALGAGTAAAALRTTLASDDPAVATLGATTGAAVITDANGTIQQYLRGLIKQWIAGTLVLGTGSNAIGSLTAGTATIGALFGFATTVSASVTKSSTTTTYTAGDNWSDSTSAPTAGGYTFSNAARISGGSGVITDIFISNSVGPALMLQGELWIYDSAIATNDNDNAPFTNVDADVLLAVAVVPFTLAASAVGSVNSYAHIQNLNAGFTCVGSANLRFKVKVQNAYVNTASEVLNFRLKIMQTN